MSSVHILPPEIVARIAAGEVVDRPASVLKELLENALDAGATRIEILLKGGGKSVIQVKDNGTGIVRDDLERMFHRHATSKITAAEDLDALGSLGFRGEALYSIAAVSEVTVRTRTEHAEAWEIFLRGGRREHLKPAALAERGTDVRVEEVFFNTPARKKFLKSDSAEFEAALNVILPYVLQFPQKDFILVHNDREIFNLKAVENFALRAAQALNLPGRYIMEAEDVLAAEGLTVRLVLGDINIQRARRDLQYLFVNGRPVQHKNLSFHMNDVFRLIMPEGVHPFFIVFIQVPACDVDVNIHPQKREVRIRQEGRVASFLRQAVERALMTKGQAKDAGAALSAPIFHFEPGVAREEGIPADRIIFSPRQSTGVPAFRGHDQGVQDKDSFPEMWQADGSARPDGGIKERLMRARYMGTFVRKYHLFEDGDSLFAVDQHAAQERVLFEKFLAQMKASAIEVQRLLVPLVVRLGPQDILAFESGEEDFRGCGFEVSRLDETTVSIHAHPLLLAHPREAFQALLAGEGGIRAERETIARRACRASVMTGDFMSPQQAVCQMRELAACEDPMTCPHGRPVFIELKTSFFDRQFLRSS